ncbi:MAG: phage shock envelope stress response protein PspM [Mycobacterium sp.]
MHTLHTGQWRAVLQRGFDTGYRLSDLLMQKISAAIDPRARMLRQRRRALRWGLIFGAGCVFWVLVTTVLASWTTPAWVLLITGLIAAGAAGLATLLLLRYRWLRSIPLPAQRPGTTRRLPPLGSAARPAISALGTSERGLFSLLGVLERGQLLPAGEIDDLTAAANRTAATMAATAAEVVSMERTVQLTPDSGEYLAPTINAFTAQLHAGVRQYNEMVTAAAQLVACTDSPMQRQHHREELADATDRLVGWAQAFDELGRLPCV